MHIEFRHFIEYMKENFRNIKIPTENEYFDYKNLILNEEINTNNLETNKSSKGNSETRK